MQLKHSLRGITEGQEALLCARLATHTTSMLTAGWCNSAIFRCTVCQKVFSSVESFWHCSECELWSLICEQCEKQQQDPPDTPTARQDSWPAPILQNFRKSTKHAGDCCTARNSMYLLCIDRGLYEIVCRIEANTKRPLRYAISL